MLAPPKNPAFQRMNINTCLNINMNTNVDMNMNICTVYATSSFVKMKFRNVLALNIKWNRFNFSLQSWWNCKKWSQSRKWLLIEVMIKWFDFFRNVFLMKHIIHIILFIIQERVFCQTYSTSFILLKFYILQTDRLTF